MHSVNASFLDIEMKKLRSGVKLKSSGGLLDLFDNAFKASFNITDAEYDFISETASEDDLDSLLAVFDQKPTFSELRKALQVRNRYLKDFRARNEKPC